MYGHPEVRSWERERTKGSRKGRKRKSGKTKKSLSQATGRREGEDGKSRLMRIEDAYESRKVSGKEKN